jgi:2-polyprenyl-6-methoxyphenol hydroxylase-like FAD-dependent oxidoreductase
MHALGLLDQFLKLPHQKVHEITGIIGNETITFADFSHLPTRCHFIAFIPQWDFLDFLAAQGKRYPGFHLRMRATVDDLLWDGERVVGLKAKLPRGSLEVRADLVVGADGRHSAVRALAGLPIKNLSAPMDVLWFKLSKRADDGSAAVGRFQAGRLFVMLDRGEYWQCAYVIPKDGFNQVRCRGLNAFRQDIATLNPVLAGRVNEVSSWDDVSLLTVRVDRLKRWYRDGLLCIGDAAHAMSPVGGVGINLAIQDAVAADNILAAPLRSGFVPEETLRKVQERREWPTRMTQAVQLIVQNRVIRNVLSMTAQPRPPFVARLLQRFPWLRRIPGRLIGMGFRPEHVRTPEVKGQ